MIDNSGGSTWMSESVTHSRPFIRSESADHFAGGTTLANREQDVGAEHKFSPWTHGT